MKVGSGLYAVPGVKSSASEDSERCSKGSASIRKNLFLTEEEVEKLILDHRENGRKLARSLLRRWRVRMPPHETDSLVDLALCDAASRFSPNKGASFMTFLYYHLRGYLVRSIESAATHCAMTVDYTHVSGMDIAEWAPSGAGSQALSSPDVSIFKQHDDSPEDQLLLKEKIENCRKACSVLDSLEHEVIIRSFHQEESLVNIAASLGYSRCHISRVKKRALQRVRYAMDKAEYGDIPQTLSAKIKRRARRKAVAPQIEFKIAKAA